MPIDFLFTQWRFKFILSALGANVFVLGEPDFDAVDVELSGQPNIVDHPSTTRDIKCLLCEETWIDQHPTPAFKNIDVTRSYVFARLPFPQRHYPAQAIVEIFLNPFGTGQACPGLVIDRYMF